jgi:hypothetical protein
MMGVGEGVAMAVVRISLGVGGGNKAGLERNLLCHKEMDDK